MLAFLFLFVFVNWWKIGNFNLTIAAKCTCTFRSYETIVRIESTLVLSVVRWYDQGSTSCEENKMMEQLRITLI